MTFLIMAHNRNGSSGQLADRPRHRPQVDVWVEGRGVLAASRTPAGLGQAAVEAGEVKRTFRRLNFIETCTIRS